MRKQVLVTADRGETRVAILEAEEAAEAHQSRRVGELYIERRGSRSIVGNIYKGKVDNVLPGLEAAFVDIGLEKNGFLHADDVVIPGVEVARRGRADSKGKRITELLKPGQEILVQAVKDPLKTKGPRLSMQLSIAGRYLVYVPQGEGIGVSRRLDDKERERLRKQAKGLDIGDGGAIIRTAAQGAKKADFEREISYLHKLHEVLQKRAKEADARRRWSSRRPTWRCAWCATSSPSSSSARSWTTPSSTTAWSRSSPAPRPSCSSASSSTRTRSTRCSRSTASRRRSSRRCGGAWTCPPAATC